MDERENPFRSALFRDIVDSVHFIGREHILQQIRNAVILPEEQKGSIAIIGLPDVGKRCLIEKAIQRHKDTIHNQKAIYIMIDIKSYTAHKEHDDFFRALIAKFLEELEYVDFTDSQISEIEQLTKEKLREWDNGIRQFVTLQSFFRKIHKAGYQVIFILDNFDTAESLFKEHTNRIYWLRELAGPSCRVTWVALSCKPIREIKRLPKPVSDDFTNSLHLGMFTDDEVSLYFRLLAQKGIPLTTEQKKQIISYCGKHPYLLSLLGYYLIEDYAHQPDRVAIQSTFLKVEERFYLSYERIIDLVLTNDDDTNKLHQLGHMLLGQTVGIENKAINEMLAYGLIAPATGQPQPLELKEPTYSAFSEHFQKYLFKKVFASQSSTEGEAQGHIRVFFSYAEQDEKLAQQFISHFAPVIRQKDIQFWYNETIRAGDTRKSVITARLENTHLFLLFITPHFMSDAQCIFETQQALAHHVSGKSRVVPILVRPVASPDKSSFEGLQAVPKNGKPVILWKNTDEAWLDVIEQIQKLIPDG